MRCSTLPAAPIGTSIRLTSDIRCRWAPALRVGSELSLDPDDVVAAFVGSELRGVVSPSVDSTANTNAVYLTVYSNVASGELVTFKMWDNDACGLLNVSQTTSFTTDSFNELAELTASSLDAQQIALTEGWTWFSLNRDVSALTIDEALASVVAETDDIIRSQADFSMYVAESDGVTSGWIGSLSGLTTGESYQIKLSQPAMLIVAEPNVDETAAITLAAGWNWLGYLPDDERDVTSALSDLGGAAADGDLVKSQTAFAQYNLASGTWIGSLTTMAPGQGYLIDTENGATFAYGGSSAGEAALSQAMPTDALGDSPQKASKTGAASAPRLVAKNDARMNEALSLAKQYRHSMTLSGVVKLDGELLADTSVTVYAMVNDKVRGRAKLQYVDALNEYRVFMMLYADTPNGESLSLHIDHPASGQTFVMEGDLPFMVNTAFGTPTEPVALSAETEAYKAMKAMAALPQSFDLAQNYPNPFNPITTLHYELPEAAQVRLVVYDVLGRQVATLVDEQKEAGRYDVQFDASRLSSGTYFYRIEAGSFQAVKQMILLK